MGGQTAMVEHEQVQGSTAGHLASSATANAGGGQSPKSFMAQKRPSSGIERVACLAYYLDRYRGTQQFKTRDLTKLNTEAAQPTLSNAAVFARNAVDAQYLSKAGGGAKQITVLGEAIVDALPDREKVKAAIETHRSGRNKRAARRRKKAS